MQIFKLGLLENAASFVTLFFRDFPLVLSRRKPLTLIVPPRHRDTMYIPPYSRKA